MPDREGNGEPAANAGEEPGVTSFIHGHSVQSSAHANGPRGYLRGLDVEEAKPLFNYARLHNDAQFEVRHLNGVRENYGLEHKGGKYTVKDQGKQKIGNNEKR